MVDLPLSFVQLIQAFPLPEGSEQIIEQLNAGEWDYWADRYASKAVQQGSNEK